MEVIYTPSSRGQKRKHEGDDDNVKAAAILSGAPRELMITDYAESRAVEIEALNAEVAIVAGGQQVQQKIPRHMRRRAMSHNIKRLPRGLRRFAIHTYQNQKHLTKKKPSRYHRRRPKNLLAEYNRRRQKHVWLETHIWHAKRFHMVKKWGHCLPWKPTDKSERAAYRASKEHCLLQDQSYMCCIEVSGDQREILDSLSLITSPHTGPTFAAKSCLPGCREGHVVLYGINKYPYNAIGPVSFIWKPVQPTSDDLAAELTNQRQLWIWCHPACFHEVWSVLLKCLNLNEQTSVTVASVESCPVNADKSKITNNGKQSKTDIEADVGNKDAAPVEQFKSATLATSARSNVRMKSLSGELLRFRLTGPQSNAVVMDALQQASIVPNNGDNGRWWAQFYSSPQYALGNTLQREFSGAVGQCQSPAELQPHCIVGMTVRDPRLTRHDKRTKVTANATDTSVHASMFSVTPDLATSALWEGDIRREVKDTRLTDHKVHQLKSEQLIPGTVLDLGDEEARIPVILVQQPGVAPLEGSLPCDACPGRGCGWDIILPQGWGMSVWLSLVYCGARCGGLHEAGCLGFEQRTCMFPCDYPDTRAGLQHGVDVEQTCVDKYNRRPPAKRPNYIKYGVVSPFYCPWSSLVHDWRTDQPNSDHAMEVTDGDGSDGSANSTEIPGNDLCANVPFSSLSQFFVLRDYKALRKLRQVTQRTGQNINNNRRPAGTARNISNTVKQEMLLTLESDFGNAVVPININMLERGCPNKFAMVCIPTDSDIVNLNDSKEFGGPVENVHEDPVKTERKMKKRLLKEKKIKKIEKIDRSMKPFHTNRGSCVKGSCDRQIIGYLNMAGFSFGIGAGRGVGFCALQGLVQLIKGARTGFEDIVLVRNPSSRQYRFARISVLAM